MWWELSIVTLGVLIALAAQQFVDGLSWDSRARNAADALRDEARNHYRYAVEWRSVEPCIYAQIDALADRLLAGGDRIDPAPVYSEPGFDFYVLRMPNRTHNRSAWDSAIGDGVTAHFDRDMRNELNTAYARIDQLNAATALNNQAYPQLFGLSRPLPIDAGSRLNFLRTLDELRGRVEYMSLLSGQVIGNIERSGLAPARAEIEAAIASGGTRRFCARRGLPLRGFSDSIQAVSE